MNYRVANVLATATSCREHLSTTAFFWTKLDLIGFPATKCPTTWTHTNLEAQVLKRQSFPQCTNVRVGTTCCVFGIAAYNMWCSLRLFQKRSTDDLPSRSSSTEGHMAKKENLKPGSPAPASGQYQQIGPQGGKGKEVTSVKGEPLPPPPKPGVT